MMSKNTENLMLLFLTVILLTKFLLNLFSMLSISESKVSKMIFQTMLLKLSINNSKLGTKPNKASILLKVLTL